MSAILDWVDKHRGLFGVGLLLWLVVLITPITLYVFFALAKEVNGALATIYVALVGLPASPVLVGFIKERLDRKRDDLGGGE